MPFSYVCIALSALGNLTGVIFTNARGEYGHSKDRENGNIHIYQKAHIEIHSGARHRQTSVNPIL